jgi:hypothetical protein
MRPQSGIATIAWILKGRGGFLGQRGHFVSTVGLDKAVVRAYIRIQTQEEELHVPMKLTA